MRPVTATYRLQLRPDFDLADACAAVDYLADLGVSHLYLSPVLTATEGSLHGYDGVDPEQLSPGLGGDDGFAALAARAHERGLGIVLDIVPHHLSTASRANRWWWDVLMFGRSARYAPFFDVDWHAPEERRRDTLLLPVLGTHYGRALEDGTITLVRDPDELAVLMVHGDLELPLAPASLGALVARAAATVGDASLAFVGRALVRLGEDAGTSPEERWADARTAVRTALDACARSDAADRAVTELVATVNADVDQLDALVDEQHYRLARWTVALDEPGYRRFFDVNTLVALRTEDPDVFGATHAKVLALVKADLVDGLRVDHVDGMAEPSVYTTRLREAAPDRWLVVEKILARDERLRPSWPVDGTTGYDFAALTTPLLVDPRGELELTETYQRVTGDRLGWEDHASQAKRDVLDTILAGDVARLAELFVRVCQRRRNWRDFTRRELHRALVAVIVAMPCYRTYGYVDGDGVRHLDDEDRRVLRAAVDTARRDEPGLDVGVFDILHAVLGFVAGGAEETQLALRFQQLTGPARAKGEEDTALYRANRLLALNDVGHDPGRFSVGPDDFHEWCLRIASDRPATLLATSTHDTKRSEDVRARLAVLSEMPARWERFVDELLDAWPAATPGVGAPIDPALAWFAAQTVVGAWPIDPPRLRGVLEKSMREAKVATSWLQPDDGYEAAVQAWGEALLTDESLRRLVVAMADDVRTPGQANSLVLTTLRCTAPGVPDTYQGSERWDLSLVDPDNRRPVDLAANRAMLTASGQRTAAECWATPDDGAPKLRWLADLLALRRRRPRSFVGGTYEPLATTGPEPAAAVAFARGDDVVVVAPRWFVSGRAAHVTTTVPLPHGTWRDLATGALVDGGAPRSVGDLTAAFPVAVLERA